MSPLSVSPRHLDITEREIVDPSEQTHEDMPAITDADAEVPMDPLPPPTHIKIEAPRNTHIEITGVEGSGTPTPPTPPGDNSGGGGGNDGNRLHRALPDNEPAKKDADKLLISPGLSYFLVGIVSMIVSFVCWWITTRFIDGNWMICLSIFMLVPFLVIRKNANIPSFHHGVPKIFGERWNGFVFKEGDPWRLPSYIMTIQPVSLKDQPISVPKGIDDPPFSFPARGSDGGNTRMFAKITIPVEVVDTYRYLEVDPETVDTFFAKSALDALRSYAAQEGKNDQQLLAERDIVAKYVSDQVSGDYRERYGRNVRPIILSHFEQDPDLLKAQQELEREKAEAKAERKNIDTVVELNELLIKKFPGLSDPERLALIQSERLGDDGQPLLRQSSVRILGASTGLGSDIVAAAQVAQTTSPTTPKKEGK